MNLFFALCFSPWPHIYISSFIFPSFVLCLLLYSYNKFHFKFFNFYLLHIKAEAGVWMMGPEPGRDFGGVLNRLVEHHPVFDAVYNFKILEVSRPPPSCWGEDDVMQWTITSSGLREVVQRSWPRPGNTMCKCKYSGNTMCPTKSNCI